MHDTPKINTNKVEKQNNPAKGKKGVRKLSSDALISWGWFEM
jgi:hypothetical protein